ncbi:MAG: hypothetical protein LBV38_00840 [Alistipes sp.]|jgi:hypothetical protein|nr:hypothetical protein [Alistipes sp.]
MAPTYTLGPWTVVPGHGYKIEQWKGDANEDVGNISLISAAPDLLEALEELHDLLDEHLPPWYLHEHHLKAKSAIQKAKGEQR